MAKIGVDELTGLRREIDIKYKFYLKTILKSLGCKIEILAAVFDWITKQKLNLLLFYQTDIGKNWGWRIYRTTTGKWRQIRKWFLSLVKGSREEIGIIADILQWFLKEQVNFDCVCKVDIGKSWGWGTYRATTGNWYQIWIWFEKNFKEFRVQIEILGAVFDWITKQQLNLLLLLSDWYRGKLGLTDLLDSDVR